MSEFLVIPNEFEEQRLFESYALTKDQIKKDVAVVRDWMSLQPHLPKFPESKNGKYNNIYITTILICLWASKKTTIQLKFKLE